MVRILRAIALLFAGVCVEACVDNTMELDPRGADGGSISSAGDSGVAGPKPERLKPLECQVARGAQIRGEPSAMTVLPGGPMRTDSIALLTDEGAQATLTVFNPLNTAEPQTRTYVNESARAVHGYLYTPERPVLAVATSRSIGQREALAIYTYELRGGELVEIGGVSEPMMRDCPEWRCGSAMPDCRLELQFQTEVTMTDGDLDGDGKADLIVGTSASLPIVTYRSSLATGGLYREDGCSCARFGQAPTMFTTLSFGGDDGSTDPRFSDLAIGAPSGLLLRYASDTGSGPELSCGYPDRLGSLSPVRAMARAHFQDVFDDLVVVKAQSLGGGSFDDPGEIRVIFGAAENLMSSDYPPGALYLEPKNLGGGPARDPRAVAVGDLDGDGNEDFAVLFASSGEIHLWLGGGDRTFEEDQGVVLGCPPLRALELADFDGDGADEIAVICNPTQQPVLKSCAPAP